LVKNVTVRRGVRERMSAIISVLGAGSWGTALAVIAARRGHRVRLWGRRPDQIDEMKRTRCNPDYLAGHYLPDGVEPVSDMERAVQNSGMILVVVASVGMRDVARELSRVYPESIPVVSATKGLEPETDMRMSEVLAEEIGPASDLTLCALSGPNFAEEIVQALPAGTVVAAEDEAAAQKVQKLLTGPELRVYTSDDIVGVEFGGALKNIYAIGAGIADSLQLGYNVQATLITRGLAELIRLGINRGAHPLTFSGLSGLGDMVLTCTSDLSRNRTAGREIGAGRSPQDIAGSGKTVEGIRATRAAREMAERAGVEMPIIDQLYEVLFTGKSPQDAIRELMERAARTEREEEFVAATRASISDDDR